MATNTPVTIKEILMHREMYKKPNQNKKNRQTKRNINKTKKQNTEKREKKNQEQTKTENPVDER